MSFYSPNIIETLLANVRTEINNCHRSERGIVRIETPVPALAPLQWLAAQQHCSRYYWCDRTRYFEMAGVGEAHVIAPSGLVDCYQAIRMACSRLLKRNSAVRYYGGFRFYDNDGESGRWHDFKAFRFVVPLFEVCRKGSAHYFVCNLMCDMDRHTILTELERLVFVANPGAPPLPVVRNRSDLPDRDAWGDLVARALRDFNAGVLEKVVLARQTTFYADSNIDPVALMLNLAAQAPNTYLFCFQPSLGRAFLGASPECLYTRQGNTVASEALAGTRPRGKSKAIDYRLEKELSLCEKEHREHAIVVDALSAVLDGFCEHLDVAPKPGIMKLAHCQHLHTPIEGTLRSDVGDADLLKALHPTPAVGGLPQKEAVRWILEQEPFERGIYAAPVGWIGADAAAFCVGIRSAMIQAATLTLYAGAGIVAGADAESEWCELDAKMAAMMQVIMEQH